MQHVSWAQLISLISFQVPTQLKGFIQIPVSIYCIDWEMRSWQSDAPTVTPVSLAHTLHAASPIYPNTPIIIPILGLGTPHTNGTAPSNILGAGTTLGLIYVAYITATHDHKCQTGTTNVSVYKRQENSVNHCKPLRICQHKEAD